MHKEVKRGDFCMDLSGLRIKKDIEEKVGEPIPTSWFFKEHRIPLLIRFIDEGKPCYCPSFFEIVSERWIANYYNLRNFYWRWGRWAT